MRGVCRIDTVAVGPAWRIRSSRRALPRPAAAEIYASSMTPVVNQWCGSGAMRVDCGNSFFDTNRFDCGHNNYFHTHPAQEVTSPTSGTRPTTATLSSDLTFLSPRTAAPRVHGKYLPALFSGDTSTPKLKDNAKKKKAGHHKGKHKKRR